MRPRIGRGLSAAPVVYPPDLSFRDTRAPTLSISSAAYHRESRKLPSLRVRGASCSPSRRRPNTACLLLCLTFIAQNTIFQKTVLLSQDALGHPVPGAVGIVPQPIKRPDRKSTRLNSSHVSES